MKSKGTLILAGVVVILGAYAYYDYHSENSRVEKKAEQAKLLTLKKDQIDDVKITKNDKIFEMKRTPDGWKITQPIQDWADNDGVDIFLSTMETESALDTAKEGDKIDWSLYGLDKPLGVIELHSSSGETAFYEVSTKKNFEQNTFLRRNHEDKVLVVSATWQARANKNEMELRDKRLLRHSLASIEKLDLNGVDGKLSLTMKDGQWHLTDKPEQKLDQNKVREALQHIVDTQAMDFISDKAPTAAEKKKYFLNKPSEVLELKLGDKTWKAVFGEAPTHELYAWVSDPVFLLRVEPVQIQKLFHLKPLELYAAAPGQPKGTIPTGYNPEMKLNTKVLPTSGEKPAQEKK